MRCDGSSAVGLRVSVRRALCLRAAGAAQSRSRRRVQRAAMPTAPRRSSSSSSTQPLNNQPVWSEVRSGAPQYTSIRGRETNVLIQPQGQTWRALRNGQVAVYGGWALVVVLLAIAAFYFVARGRCALHEPPTGRMIRRFTDWQRPSTGRRRSRS